MVTFAKLVFCDGIQNKTVLVAEQLMKIYIFETVYISKLLMRHIIKDFSKSKSVTIHNSTSVA